MNDNKKTTNIIIVVIIIAIIVGIVFFITKNKNKTEKENLNNTESTIQNTIVMEKEKPNKKQNSESGAIEYEIQDGEEAGDNMDDEEGFIE